MSNSVALFACSKCFSKYPFEELSSGQQLCKNCRGSFPIVKCTYCRSEFQQTNKLSTSTICSKCEHNVKQFGKPSACEYCNIIAAFIGNKCQRCTNSERKYGPPVTCEQCKQKCAFDRKDDDKKVDGKLLCWLCTLSFKRALAKTKQSDADRRAQLKLAAQRSNKNRENRPSRGSSTNNKRSASNRSDPAKLETGLEALPPVAKAMRTNRPPGDLVDPNSSDHVVAMTQLKEQMVSLQKQICQKDALLLSKDKTITELKAKHFTNETELRNKMLNTEREFEKKVETLSSKIKQLQKEVATLSKANKNKNNTLSSGAGSGGSGTDSPLP
ncbi:protein FAM76A isoform X3 [Halyomorpha halys]|uniref:protein FAM76A isoform X3 n=1 Tax=Halyomorpha halys TaxID=286706 RepID=UPI0006D5195B|nr:protein FAM76A isoform X1 [Halyomorpha halys]